MDRRSFLKKAGLGGGAVAASTLAAPAIAQGNIELKMVTSWPKNFPGLGTAPEHFARIINAATDGRITIKVFAGGELVPPLKVNDAVQEGTAEMYHSADYYYQGKSQAYPFFTTVPFGLTATEIESWIYHGGGQALWDEVGAQFGIKHLICGNSGSQMGGWFREPVTSLDDIKGLKMRIPGFGGRVIEALGGTSVTLPGAEILPALQSGTIDATEWVGPWNDLAFGIYKVTKFYHWPGFHEPGTTLSLGIGTSVWESMSEADKALFEAVAAGVNSMTLAEFNANNTQALNTLINTHGVELIEFSDEVYQGFGEASKDVLSTVGNSDEMATKVYTSFMDFRKKAIEWSDLSDRGYMNKRALTDI